MEGLEDIQEALDSLKGAASGLESPIADVIANLKALGLASTDAGGRLRDASGKFISKDMLASLAGGGADAAAGLAKLGAAAEGAGSESGGAGGDLTKLGGDMESLLGKATNLGGGLGQVQKLLGGLGPEGQAAAAAIGVVVGAATTAIGVLTQLGEAAISVVQQRAGLLATFSALAGGGAAGGATLAMVERLGQTLPFATAQIGQWAQSLMAAGIQGKDLESAVKAVAAATAIMGESGGAAAQNLLSKLAEGGKGAETLIKSLKEGGGKSNKMLAEMGLSTKDLAAALGLTVDQLKTANLSAEQMQKAIEKALQKKGAGPLEELGMTLPVLIQKVKEGFASLFTDLGPAVKPFMKEVKSLFAEFSKGGSVIKALKPIVTAVLGTLFSWGTAAVKVIHDIVTWFMNSGKAGGVFSGVLAVLKVGWKSLVAIFAVVKAALSPMIGMLKAIFSNATVLSGIKTIFAVIAGAVMLVIGIFISLIAVVTMVVGAIVAGVGIIVGAVVGVVGAISDFVSQAIDSLSGLGGAASTAASGFIDGLVGGIASGVGAVIGAVTGLAGSIKSGLLGALGIHSPSTFAMGAATNVTDTFADTVEDGAPDAGKAMTKLAQPPKMSKSGAKGGGKEKGGYNLTFNDCTFNGTTEDDFADQLAKALDIMRRQGAEPEPQT